MDRARLAGAASSALSTVAGALRRHWIFALLVLAGVALRVVTMIAYRPAIFGITDSYWYLRSAGNLEPEGLRPVGYSAFLKLLPLDSGLGVVTLVQHAIGVLLAVLVYAVLVRLGVRTWLAALAAAPALLDAYLVNIEHHILAETVVHLLVVGACVALLWRRPLGLPSAALAGLLLAGAALTRRVGVALIAPAVLAALFLPARRHRALTALALVALFAIPLGG